MAQKDLTVRLNVEDQLTGTLKGTQKALADTGKAASKLDDIRAQFEKITSSTAPAKRQLRDLMGIMTKMNLDGLSNTDVFTEIAEKAGQLKDAMGDAAAAAGAFANDAFNFQAAAQGMQLVASAGSVATGVMGMFGAENEKVTQAILKVQSAMAILNGVQSIANLLNKDSALMLKIKQIRMRASAAATTVDTAATAANTVATSANNKAQQAWNVTKAIAKALLGDFSGLVILATAGIATYALSTSDATEEQEKNNETMTNAQKAWKQYGNEVAASASKTVSRFSELASTYAKCKTTLEKNDFWKDNKKAIDELGLAVGNLNDLDEIFIKNSAKIIEMLELRAQAAALNGMRTQAWEEFYKYQFRTYDDISHTVSGSKTEDAQYDDFSQGMKAKYGEYYDSRRKRVLVNGKWQDLVKDGKFTAYGAMAYNRWADDANAEQAERWKRAAGLQRDKMLAQINQEDSSIQARMAALNVDDYFKKPDATTNAKAAKSPTETKKNEPTYDPGSIADLTQRNSEINKILKERAHLTQDEIDNLLAERKLNEDLIEEYSIMRGLKEAEKKEPVPVTATIGGATLSDGQMRGGYEDKRESLDYARSKASELTEAVADNIISKEAAQAIIDQLNTQLQALGLEPVKLEIDTNSLAKSLDAVTETVSSLSSAFGSLGSAVGGAEGEIVSFFGSTLDGVSKLIPQIMALIPALQAEAIAAGTASSAGVPFPGNIAAIASIVATLAGIFASLPKFAEGGIIGGSSHTGDNLLVKANSGEMILTRSQQGRLWDLLDGGSAGGALPHSITLKAKGSDLVAVIDSTTDKRKRQG